MSTLGEDTHEGPNVFARLSELSTEMPIRSAHARNTIQELTRLIPNAVRVHAQVKKLLSFLMSFQWFQGKMGDHLSSAGV